MEAALVKVPVLASFLIQCATAGKEGSFPSSGERSQVTLTGDRKGPVPLWILDLCSDEDAISSCCKAPGPRERWPLTLLHQGRHEANLGSDWGQRACALPSRHRAGNCCCCCHLLYRGGLMNSRACWQVISAQMYSVPLTLNIFYQGFSPCPYLGTQRPLMILI